MLLPMVFDGSNVTMNESDEVWRLVNHEYVMIWIVQTLYAIGKNSCSELAVTDDVQLNRGNIAFKWCSMQVSASKN